jgi:4-aminobutyrate aminotransferase/(S)-3-amino-2-methylpropionate transaminase
MNAAPWGERTPHLTTPIPGPRSRQLAARLQKVESPNITAVSADGPIFWSEAAGANVRDVDGNVFVDLTAGFGVVAAGHGSTAVAQAVERQVRRLVHSMGDVHPADLKVELLERLAALAPGDLSTAILSANGSDAVESALKTAVMATGRPGLVAFEGGYHGLGYGALSVTSEARFRTPFDQQIFHGVGFAPFPDGGQGEASRAATEASLASVRSLVRDARTGSHPVGAIIVEPIQGRAGIRVPPGDFLPRLKDLCTELDVLLILDEVYTGIGRTGRWFACQHWDIVPDLLVLGKALAGGLPLSAVVGRPAVMEAWPASAGEAIHTSTFLGNPVTCAAALAHLREVERAGLVERASELGRWLGGRLGALAARQNRVTATRGLGLMQAVALAGGAESASHLAAAALRRGVILLPEGDALALTPPLVITEPQLDHAVGVVESLLEEATR